MEICIALLEGRLETTCALSVTTLAVPTSLQRLSDLLQNNWPDMLDNVASRIVNAVSFGRAGSARANSTALHLAGVHLALYDCSMLLPNIPPPGISSSHLS